MRIKRKLKKLGYSMEDLNAMKVCDIIKLGDMGYTKEEITAMQEQSDTTNLEEQIESLQAEIKSLKEQRNLSNIRETVSETKSAEQTLEESLKMLGGEV